MAKAACDTGVYRDHEHRIKTSEEKHIIATASRSNLHKRIDGNVARMNMWKYLFIGGGVVFTAISGVTTAIMLGFWWMIGNEAILTALLKVKDAG